MPEQRKRLHCVAEITLSMTFLLVSEVPAIAAFARSGLPQERNSKTHASGFQKPTPDVKWLLFAVPPQAESPAEAFLNGRRTRAPA